MENWQGVELSPEGLSPQSVRRQRGRFGANTIVEVSPHPWLELARDTVRDPMLWFLVGVGSLFLWLGEFSDGITLLIAILPLTLMDAFLHWRTQASTQNLKSNLISEVQVLREGRWQRLDSRELVPGDLVELKPAMPLPADGLFELSEDLQVDESVLTGEAFPIRKQSLDTGKLKGAEAGEFLIEAAAFGSAGTRALSGRALLRILKTGAQTRYGQIVLAVSKMPQQRTPLQSAVAGLVARLIQVAGALCVLLAAVRVYQGFGWIDALLSSATLAVAAIPEEFPVVLTFFLAVGIYRLAQKKALVRRAVTVENIGRTSWICTDKTGTLTVGELKLTHLVPARGFGELQVLQIAFPICSEESQDPVDLAIRQMALEKKSIFYPVQKRFPFTEDRKKESVFCEMEDGLWCLTKGAPEALIAMTSIDVHQRQEWLTRISEWARQGHKVLGCARRKLNRTEFERGLELDNSFEFCGLLAFEDPFRLEVPEAIAYCRDQDIKVLMMTGDHPETAGAIARDVGLGSGSEGPRVLSAEAEPQFFSESSGRLNVGALREFDVIARCTPLQKLRIVEALKEGGEIVAVTGDGVNDVPALKMADIGIAMGLRGTRSAREVSSIILADDNFRSLVGAIHEGRKLFAGLKLSFGYLLLIHIPFVATAAVIPLLGYPLVYLPVHIVWLELIIHPTAVLAFHSLQTERPERPDPHFFKFAQAWRLGLSGAVLALVLIYLFMTGFQESEGLADARAQAMALLVTWSSFLVVALTGLKNWSARITALLTLAVSIPLIQIPALSAWVGLAPLHGQDWIEIFLMAGIFAGLTRWSKAL